MLGHVWHLTLRTCLSVKVPEKTLTPGPKMQYCPAQQTAHHGLGLSVVFPPAHRKTGRASKGLPNATHQSLPPPTVDSVASTLRSQRSARGLAYHSRQWSLLPSPLIKARLGEDGVKGLNACSPLTWTRKGLRLGLFYGFAQRRKHQPTLGGGGAGMLKF